MSWGSCLVTAQTNDALEADCSKLFVWTLILNTYMHINIFRTNIKPAASMLICFFLLKIYTNLTSAPLIIRQRLWPIWWWRRPCCWYWPSPPARQAGCAKQVFHFCRVVWISSSYKVRGRTLLTHPQGRSVLKTPFDCPTAMEFWIWSSLSPLSKVEEPWSLTSSLGLGLLVTCC
jgi:hypothetical protein